MNPGRLLILGCLLAVCALPVRAIDYTLPDLAGQPHALHRYLGKWVVVNYWATWCGTCREEIPELIALHEHSRAGDVAVIGVNFETIGNERLKTFVAEHGISYPVLLDEPVPVTAIGRVPALPTTYIVDPQGRVVAGEVGLVTRQQLEDYIDGKQGGNAVAVGAVTSHGD
jgi:thiol-disulfide isomerase/thioredoxin